MTTRRKASERGNALIEFTLVGIGLVFVLISTFEMARGMWIYHTLAHVSKEATRFLVVHGAECQTRGSCAAESTLGTLSSRVQFHGVGLMPEDLEIQVFINGAQVVGSGGGFVSVISLAGSSTVWNSTAKPGDPIQVVLRYPFRSALAMLWAGSARVDFTAATLGASSWDTIQF